MRTLVTAPGLMAPPLRSQSPREFAEVALDAGVFTQGLLDEGQCLRRAELVVVDVGFEGVETLGRLLDVNLSVVGEPLQGCGGQAVMDCKCPGDAVCHPREREFKGDDFTEHGAAHLFESTVP